MTWNILEGMHVLKKDQADLEPKMDDLRLRAVQEVINSHRPDVLVLNEALWCNPREGYVVNYAELLGFPYSFADIYDGVWGNVILSRAPFSSTERFRIHNRGGLRVTLDTPSPFLVATYHPHPSRYPAHKAKDFGSLLKDITIPAVVCGDFNAISPEDAPDEVALAAAFARFTKHPASSLSRFTEGGREVFGELSRLGFRDAIPVPKRQPTMPTDLVTTDKSSGMRIDHVWVNKGVDVIGGDILRGPSLEIASDHYPVSVDLVIQ